MDNTFFEADQFDPCPFDLAQFDPYLFDSIQFDPKDFENVTFDLETSLEGLFEPSDVQNAIHNQVTQEPESTASTWIHLDVAPPISNSVQLIADFGLPQAATRKRQRAVFEGDTKSKRRRRRYNDEHRQKTCELLRRLTMPIVLQVKGCTSMEGTSVQGHGMRTLFVQGCQHLCKKLAYMLFKADTPLILPGLVSNPMFDLLSSQARQRALPPTTTQHFTEDSIAWDIDVFVSGLGACFSPDHPFSTPFYLSALKANIGFIEMTRDLLDPKLCQLFQQFMLASSLVYSIGPQMTPSSMWMSYRQAENVAPGSTLMGQSFRDLGVCIGRDLLQELDKTLRSDQRATYTQQKLKALFLVLLGTVLAIEDMSADYLAECNLILVDTQEMTTTKADLLRILYHHLYLVGHRAGLVPKITFGDLRNRVAILQDGFLKALKWTAVSEFVEGQNYSTPFSIASGSGQIFDCEYSWRITGRNPTGSA
ncbi:uncharacterized protein KY384_001193 [Bacidia gigantensis]|uniref:uncharacterized protein n=1 Tax=Bacidia gigantensis TaxID=2732470 RepID=UPI001D0502C9|nr:uncharacterized protein KY384_001193 [Bacidia gigantensis]KAG8534349.1 hypothetical protein KY384_001193 [Bacidia gigantensis]